MHWKPSEVVDNEGITYDMITMPQCETLAPTVPCVYELTPILKYVSPKLSSSMEPVVWSMSKGIAFADLLYIFKKYNALTMENGDLKTADGRLDLRTIRSVNDRLFSNQSTLVNLYNRIACEWYQLPNSSIHNISDANRDKIQIQIGGMFPQSNAYTGLELAAKMAEMSVADNKVLDNIKFDVLINNGECKSDAVMKNFVHFYTKSDRVLGVLGPACSETVEPIAGVSKHFRMPIISYSAEGASFIDRNQYPYFFRTIGDNRQ